MMMMMRRRRRIARIMAMCLMIRTKMMMMEIMMMTCCEKIKMSREPPNGKHQPASHHCVIGVIGPENEYNQFEIQRYQRKSEYLHFTSLKPGQRLPAVPETTFVHFFHFHASVSIQH